jgi:hypothetical protein
MFSAYIQLNDPDPYHWFAIYFLVGILHLIAVFRPLSKKMLWIAIIALVVYAFYHFNYFVDWLQIDNKNEIFGEMVYDKPYLEGTREFLGLLICAFSLTFHIKKAR